MKTNYIRPFQLKTTIGHYVKVNAQEKFQLKRHLVFIVLTLCFLFFKTSVFSQEAFNCINDPTPIGQSSGSIVYSGAYDQATLDAFDYKIFNIYFWGIKTSDNKTSIDESRISEAMIRINKAFNPLGICFVYNGYDYIEGNDLLYDNASYSEINTYASANGYKKTNAINCYLPKVFNATYSGAFHDKSIFVRTYSKWSGDDALPRVMNHELGHLFGLKHAHGDGSGELIKEHVTRDDTDPNYNALTAGDMVHDTPAIPNFWHENFEPYEIDGQWFTVIDLEDCSYDPIYGFQDEQDTPLELTPYDIMNFMVYGPVLCKSHFTIGQGIRMHETIENSPFFLDWYNSEAVPDLYIKDSPDDFGIEPNLVTEHLWESKDIWVRNQDDAIEENENPFYDSHNPNFVYVRVQNRGCSPSSGDDELILHWTKAATNLDWDYSWMGNPYFEGDPGSPLLGDVIGSVSIPALDPGDEIVLSVPWQVPNPIDYVGINTEPWHFCLLARIISDDDPIHELPYGSTSLTEYVRNNNNVAWKNVTAINLKADEPGQPIGGVIAVGNPLKQTETFDLQFSSEDGESGKEIFEEAEIVITLDPTMVQAWEDGGKRMTNLLRKDTNVFIVEGQDAVLHDMTFSSRERGTVLIEFHFLTQEITEKQTFIYKAIQKISSTGEVFGGETYEINKEPRPLFFAFGGEDNKIDKGDPVALNAQSIGEPAFYNWYDEEGDLVYQGADFNTSVIIGEKYKLEVIAASDGYKDYTEVKVQYHSDRITQLYPNPSSGMVAVSYKINEGNTAYLSVVSLDNPSQNVYNYVLDIEESETNLDLTQLPPGLYAVGLISNGILSDSKNLIKN